MDDGLIQEARREIDALRKVQAAGEADTDSYAAAASEFDHGACANLIGDLIGLAARLDQVSDLPESDLRGRVAEALEALDAADDAEGVDRFDKMQRLDPGLIAAAMRGLVARAAPAPETINPCKPCEVLERPMPAGYVDDLIRAATEYRPPPFVQEAFRRDPRLQRAWTDSFAGVRAALRNLPPPSDIPF